MPPVIYNSILALEDNSTEMYMTCTDILLRIARNILKEPENPKYRSISLGSNIVTNKLLPASGAIQCLFEMGFQEGSDKLVLPQDSSLVHVRAIHDELLKGRELRKIKKADLIKDRPEKNPSHILIEKEIIIFMDSVNNQLVKEFVANIFQILECENTFVQLKALNCIPLVDLKKNVEKTIKQIQIAFKEKDIEEEVIDYQELLLLELCKWFKSSFFQWVDSPECTKCGCKDTKFLKKETNKAEGSIEIYNCSACNERVLFPRYREVKKLLETRRGRCGEWARCFYLICRSLGWDTRFVVDSTDHVWVEIYSLIKKRWIHCDPCETVIDEPLIYEYGWKKNLSYIMAYSKDEIQDVTWRYCSNHSKVMKNRTSCSEEQLVDVICNIRSILLKFVSAKRKEFVLKRTALELVDLLVQKSPTEKEMQGRSSGSLAWRLSRGEVTMTDELKPHIWKPAKVDDDGGKFILSYCTSSDEYTLFSSNKTLKGWQNGLYRINSVFRKEESDWKVVYLAREEGSEVGSLSWRFEVNEGFAIGDIHIKLVSQIFENGSVLRKLCNDNTCIKIPNSENLFSTTDFNGSKQVELVVELSGGSGDQAWQHAQLLRQQCSDKENTFQIIISLIRI